MKNNQNELEGDEIYNNIEFNKNELKTDENFFDELNIKSNNEDISLDLDKSEDSLSSDKLDICDKSMEEQMNKVTLNDEIKNKYSKKITKEDLNTIPIPIFGCLFCANEEIASNHLINEILSKKYLYNLEKKDIILIEFLIKNNLLELKENKENILNKFGIKHNINLYRLNSLIDMIIKNTEYIKKYNSFKDSFNYLKQKRNRENNKLKIKNISHSLNKISNKENLNFKINFDFEKQKYGNNKLELFEDDNSDDDLNKINNINNIISNNLDKSNESEDFDRIFDENCFMDLNRKIKKDDIIFEDKPYNIWENNFDDSIEKES